MSNGEKFGPTPQRPVRREAPPQHPGVRSNNINERQLQQEWSRKYDPRAVKNFLRPANKCECCGIAMDHDPKTGLTGYAMNETERKWSIHASCKEDMLDQLDRQMMKGTGH